MKRFAVRCAVVAALGGAIVIYGSVNQSARADADIQKAMKTINGGKVSVCKMLNDGVKSDEPKWDELADKAKVVVPLARAMIKAKPPKGDEDSWERLSKAYAKSAEDLEAAISKKDAKAAQEAAKGLTNCMACHSAHRVIKKKN